MEQPTNYKCHVSAALDRAHYAPGDRVSGQCYLHCSSDVAVKTRGGLKPLMLCNEDDFFCTDAGGFADEDGEKAILVHSVVATVECRCDTNFDLLRLPWGPYAEATPSPLDGSQGKRGGIFSSWMAGGRAASRVLFRTPKWDLLSGTPLSNGQCLGVGFSFSLPEGVAPSFIGRACQLRTVMQLDVAWRVRRGKASSTVQTMSLALPIRILSAPSEVPLLLAAMAPVVSADSPLVLSNYDLNVSLLPAVPSANPAAAVALSATGERARVSDQEGWQAARLAQRERYSALTKARDPAHFHVVIPGSMCEVLVQLASTRVCLGDTLTGLITVVDRSAARGVSETVVATVPDVLPAESRGVLLKVDAAIENSECCLPDATPATLEPLGEDGTLRCLSTTVMDKQGWTLVQGGQSVFKFFISPYYDPTLSTDIITNVWRLRLAFVCTSQAHAERETPRGYPILLSSPELVIPLTVCPPPPHVRVPEGALFS